MGVRNGTAPSGLFVHLPERDFPDVNPGDTVNIVREIKASESEAHEQPYLQVPKVGPFDMADFTDFSFTLDCQPSGERRRFRKAPISQCPKV